MCENDIENLLKDLNFEILEKFNFENFTIIKTKSKKFKNINFKKFTENFSFIFISSA
jgi:hypothetical protein